MLYASNIRRKRKELGLTQSVLGMGLGVDKSTVCRMEYGKMRGTDFERLADLCNVLKVPPDYFYKEHV